jgi:RES domain-containing protein
MVSAYRIVKADRVRTAFNGQGAKRRGGRWNQTGVAVVYTSASAGLAALEVLVHTETPELLEEYCIIPCEIPDDLIERLDETELPLHWRRTPAPEELARLGTTWADSGRSCALQVPSVLVPFERNYILNPQHPEFHRITIGAPQAFQFDQRLKE